MKNGRRKFSGDEKMAILRRHLVDKVPVSDVCDQVGIRPTLFYRWQKELFDRDSADTPHRVSTNQSENDMTQTATITRNKIIGDAFAEYEINQNTATRLGTAEDYLNEALRENGYPPISGSELMACASNDRHRENRGSEIP